MWSAPASNGKGTCGAQISWVRDHVPAHLDWAAACKYVAIQPTTPECAPCHSEPPPPPLLPSLAENPTGVYCFVVIAREFGEVPRARNILDAGPDAGFSGCDEWHILSNASYLATLSNHPRCVYACVERAINGSMDVPYGKPDWADWAPTALNTPIFQQVWRHVVASSVYRRHAWTVKTEVDVVFAASHLRAMLLATKLASRSAFTLNYPGVTTASILRGPVEALTLPAVEALAARQEVCNDIAQHNPLKGEDWWLALCLHALGVEAVPMPKQLHDQGSNQGAQRPWSRCDLGFAAYHPRKLEDDWSDCYQELRSCESSSCGWTQPHGCAGQHNNGTYTFWCCCVRPESL